MIALIRLPLAIVSGLAGLFAFFLVLKPGALPSQQSLLLGTVTLLMAATLFNTVLDVMMRPPAEAAALPPPATAADREVHSEVVKVVTLLKRQLDASATFSAALDKARLELPEALQPAQVQLIIGYLLTENEGMRSRTVELQASLERSQRQIEKLKSNLAEAEAQGLSDPLTGLKNRRSFDITLAAEIAAARGSDKPLSLIIADIDHFKSINDRYGHPAGDDVLKWFAKILSNSMKGRDTVARYGGEEFAIVLPQTPLETAAHLANQIKSHLEQQFWKKPGAPNTMLRVTASFGVAELGGGESSSGLIKRADAKLYESKAAGRNRVAA